MAGMVARIDLWISEIIATRSGWVPAYPVVARADAQARLLQLHGLSAIARAHLAQCLVHAGDQPLSGRKRRSAPSEVDDLVAQALALGRKSPLALAESVLGFRAWFEGDTATAIQLFDESMRNARAEVKVTPVPGVGALLQVVAGTHPEKAFDPPELIGHHGNWAARAYGYAVEDLRNGRSATESISEAEYYVRHTPYWGHLLRTIVAPVAYKYGLDNALAWLREADAFCAAAGERALQRRIRHSMLAIGAKLPRTSTATVPPHLARLGITAREAEVLRLVNSGLSNSDIAGRLFLSVRTVESHVSSMLQKTGLDSREQLPSANENGASDA